MKTPIETKLQSNKKGLGVNEELLTNCALRKLENRSFDGLKNYIKIFWTIKVCHKYIRKVIPIVITNKGDATGH